MGRARQRWQTLKSTVEARHAARPARVPTVYDPSAIALGRNEAGAPVLLPERRRLEHAHVIGSIGSGKSTFLEYCIRQDITRDRGVCVLDPHGNHPDSLYRKVLTWLDARGYTKGGKNERVIHLLDPNAPNHSIGFNPLARPSSETRPEVIADLVLEAFGRVWGDEDTHSRPTIRRVLRATFTALAELGLTLAEADLLFDPYDIHGIRDLVLSRIKDRHARVVIRDLHDISQEDRSKRDFRAEVVGPMNRLAEFISNGAIRTIIGQTKNTLDLGRAFDEGHIILVNLAGGEHVEAAHVQLIGRLLTRMMLFHAKLRKRRPITPYFLYLDECHLYLSGDIQLMLAEVRKYGLGVVLSHQYLSQLGVPDDQLRAAVRNVTKFKAVFNIADHIDAEELAQAVMTLNLEMPVKASIRQTVVGHRIGQLGSESVAEHEATSETRTNTLGDSESHGLSHVVSRAVTAAEGETTSETESLSAAQGVSEISVSGFGSGSAMTEMTPATGWSGPLSIAMSTSEMSNASSGRGSSSMSGRSQGKGYARNTMHAVTVGEAWGESVVHTTHRSRSLALGKARGTTQSHGTQEAFEPIYELLPTSFHSKENAVTMAAQMLRCLNTGTAYVRYFGADGVRETFLKVPLVVEYAVPDDAFAALRDRVLSHSPAVLPRPEAEALVAERERALSDAAAKQRLPIEPETAAGYRVKKKRPTKKA